MPPHLIIMDKVVLLGVIFKKMKCVCKTQMMPPPFRRGGIKNTCHYQIFDENQNPVDMHTFINIKQNIKAVAPKL